MTMMPAIRTGLASTLELFAAWWRGQGGAAPDVLKADAAPDLPCADETIDHALAEDSLRRFHAYALDEHWDARDPAAVEDHHQPLLDAGRAALERLVVEPRLLPRRPSLLPKLLSTMNNDQNSMRELAAIIGDDPALMGNLVRLANSAFYRGVRKSIESLERAVTLVGTDGIRGLVATALLHPVMTARGGRFPTFAELVWEQTLYAADAAEMHAVHVERINGFGARLLALLNGLATNTVFRVLRDECLAESGPEAKPAVVRLLSDWVPPTSRQIAAVWEMPRDVQLALADVHIDGALQRALFVGRIAGAQILLVRRGEVKESVARATVLACDPRRRQVDRVWHRLCGAHLTPR